MDQTPPTLLDGRAVAEKIVSELAQKLTKTNGSTITLATILVGDSAPSRLYVGLKLKMAEKAGLKSQLIELPESVQQAEIEQIVTDLAQDKSINGVLIQLPLPKHIDLNQLLTLLPYQKDVDGLTPHNLGCVMNGTQGMVPCTPLGVMELLKHYQIPTQGKKAIIVGRSSLVSLPLAMLLSRKGTDCTVSICHSRTPNLAQECQQADILISACGMPGIITPEFVQPGATVVDVGVTRKGGKIYGDVDFDSVSPIAGAITPMPGGTGPMTVACLIQNTVLATELWQRR